MASSPGNTFSPTIRARKAKATSVSFEHSAASAARQALRSQITNNQLAQAKSTGPSSQQVPVAPTTTTTSSSLLTEPTPGAPTVSSGPSVAKPTSELHSGVRVVTSHPDADQGSSHRLESGDRRATSTTQRLDAASHPHAFLFERSHIFGSTEASGDPSVRPSPPPGTSALQLPLGSFPGRKDSTGSGIGHGASHGLGLSSADLTPSFRSPSAPLGEGSNLAPSRPFSHETPSLRQDKREGMSRLGRLNLDTTQFDSQNPFANGPATASRLHFSHDRTLSTLTTTRPESDEFALPPSAPAHILAHPPLGYSQGRDGRGLLNQFGASHHSTHLSEDNVLLFNASRLTESARVDGRADHPVSSNSRFAASTAEESGQNALALGPDGLQSRGGAPGTVTDVGLLTQNVRRFSLSSDQRPPETRDSQLPPTDGPPHGTLGARNPDGSAHGPTVSGAALYAGCNGSTAATRVESHLILRALVNSKEAGVIIGKNGSNVARLRTLFGVKAGVSKAVPNAPERILTVSGRYDQVANAYALLAQTLLENPITAPTAITGVVSPSGITNGRFPPYPTSPVQNHLTTVRILISHNLMGTVIGRQGLKIKHIQELSGARMDAQKEMLPQSTERVVEIQGTIKAIRIALEEVGKCLIEDVERGMGSVLYNPATRVPSISSNCNPYVCQVRVPAFSGPTPNGDLGQLSPASMHPSASNDSLSHANRNPSTPLNGPSGANMSKPRPRQFDEPHAVDGWPTDSAPLSLRYPGQSPGAAADPTRVNGVYPFPHGGPPPPTHTPGYPGPAFGMGEPPYQHHPPPFGGPPSTMGPMPMGPHGGGYQPTGPHHPLPPHPHLQGPLPPPAGYGHPALFQRPGGYPFAAYPTSAPMYPAYMSAAGMAVPPPYPQHQHQHHFHHPQSSPLTSSTSPSGTNTSSPYPATSMYSYPYSQPYTNPSVSLANRSNSHEGSSPKAGGDGSGLHHPPS
ncbi:RNA binding protein, heterogenous nuclear RNP-K like protein [Dimargaris verticillata]|uniref:RNA binding protein, heterogenous nuclear RNP-K like protein n=1 Tax=Dimargaris verticillata TaxID=2761393 RepID=A0A9W8B8Z3_9FUNG|nr:RNA binding protein, heterogenous nuclear RNP-K like protein [Dimargaris verticillata]